MASASFSVFGSRSSLHVCEDLVLVIVLRASVIEDHARKCVRKVVQGKNKRIFLKEKKVEEKCMNIL